MEKQIKLLDCTLRDGGHVNNWNFGKQSIKGIIHRLSMARVDIIELGLLKNVKFSLDSTLQPSISAFSEIAMSGNPRADQYFTVMVRPDWIDVSLIDEYSSHEVINGIRFAFYPEDIREALIQATAAKEKGYDIFLNAVGVSCYDQHKLISTINDLIALQPAALSIVDTFGAFDQDTLTKFYNAFESQTHPDITIGLHLHENKALALSLATHFSNLLKPPRHGIIDASLFGMGRIPGNLCIEQIANLLNHQNSETIRYNINHLLAAIEEYIYPIRKNFTWGYSPEYMLSAYRNLNRNYAEFFINNKLSLTEMTTALDYVCEQQGGTFKYSEDIAKLAIKKTLKETEDQ